MIHVNAFCLSHSVVNRRLNDWSQVLSKLVEYIFEKWNENVIWNGVSKTRRTLCINFLSVFHSERIWIHIMFTLNRCSQSGETRHVVLLQAKSFVLNYHHWTFFDKNKSRISRCFGDVESSEFWAENIVYFDMKYLQIFTKRMVFFHCETSAHSMLCFPHAQSFWKHSGFYTQSFCIHL